MGTCPLGLQEQRSWVVCLRVLDWTGRQLRRGKRGTIPAELADILQRLDVDSSLWLEGIEHFGQWFHRAAGCAQAMMEKAQQAGRRWFHGLGRCRQLFTPAEEQTRSQL